jgi:hypothetical protein
MFRVSDDHRSGDIVNLWRIVSTDYILGSRLEHFVVDSKDDLASVDRFIRLLSCFSDVDDQGKWSLISLVQRTLPQVVMGVGDLEAVPMALKWLIDNRERLIVNDVCLDTGLSCPDGIFKFSE